MLVRLARCPSDGGGVGCSAGYQVGGRRARHQGVDGDHVAPAAPFGLIMPFAAIAADPEVVVVVAEQAIDGDVWFIGHYCNFIDIVFVVG